MWSNLLSIDCFISGPNQIYPSTPVCVDRPYRKKVLVNQATITNVYTSVHNLHTLCCIPVCTAEPVYWTQAKWDNPHELRWPITGPEMCNRSRVTHAHTHTHRPNVEDPQPSGLWVLKMNRRWWVQWKICDTVAVTGEVYLQLGEMRRIMSGRGFVDFLVLSKWHHHRTHNSASGTGFAC
jgi:hypothetical protein